MSSLFVSLFLFFTCIFSNGRSRYLLVKLDNGKEHVTEKSVGMSLQFLCIIYTIYIVHFIKWYDLIFFNVFLGFKQEGQDCGLCLCPPTYDAGTCAPGLECKHFNPEIHAEKKHLHIDKPGICVSSVTMVFKQEGEACGVSFRPPTYDAGTCAPGLECKHFNPEIHEEKKHLHVGKPGICVRPGFMFLLNVFHINVNYERKHPI